MNHDRVALTVAAAQPGPRISRHIFGQFASDKSVIVALAHTDPVLKTLYKPDNHNRVTSKPWTDLSFDGKKLTVTLPTGCAASVSFLK